MTRRQPEVIDLTDQGEDVPAGTDRKRKADALSLSGTADIVVYDCARPTPENAEHIHRDTPVGFQFTAAEEANILNSFGRRNRDDDGSVEGSNTDNTHAGKSQAKSQHFY